MRRRTFYSPLSSLSSPLSPRAGLSLLEVLVSCFILTFGLLGVAALIPLGKMSMSEANISDRTGACGRAALREVQVRRMLDLTQTNIASFSPPTEVLCIDPLGAASIGPTLGPLSRLTYPSLTATQLDAIFRSTDELIYVLPEDSTAPSNGERPMPQMNGTVQQSLGNFSWFFTVCPSPSDINMNTPVALRRNYTVSVAVCHKRDFTGGGEQATTNGVTFIGGGFGGGTIQLAPADASILNKLKTDRWVMLVGNNGGGVPVVAKWYRVVGIGNIDPPYISLVGPDWDANLFPNPTMVVVEGVTGVYTSTIQLDDDLLWTR